MSSPNNWYRVDDDSAVSVHADSPEVRRLIDHRIGRWYGSLEGAIRHDGVQACAVILGTEQLYDAATWVRIRERVPAGQRRCITVTAGWQHIDRDAYQAKHGGKLWRVA